ncbi:MAG TPA: class I tRNA ligase family protein, partial [Ferruginibacter sp.]|nr:class I tRNA ligase family protein [Ferruginibacter sp.]
TAVDDYLKYVKSRSERERLAEAKTVTGCFTGAYAINPFDGRKIPVWTAEYVLAGYGTGAIMAVPCGDQRDFLFATHFNIPITNIIGAHFNGEEANPTKEAILENSGFLNGLLMKDAIGVAVNKIEELGIGKRKVNYKMRDAGFSRQRYWGEPFPIVWKDDIAIPLEEKDLPLELPHVDKYGPGPNGEGPLANLADWINLPSPGGEGAGVRRETSTMPGYAGSSWYFLRYMDPHNRETFCSRKASDYWNQVDLYIGGTEHAVGHLLYSRMWTKVMYDLGLIGYDEPYKRLVNQGMIQGSSRFVHRVKSTLSYRLLNELVLTHTFNDYSFYAAGEGCFISDKLKVAVGCVPTAALRNEQNLKLLGQGFEEYKEIIIPSEYFYELYFKQREEWSKRILEVIRGQINMANDFDFDYSYFISNKYLQDLKDDEYDAIRVDVKYVDGVELNIADIKDWKTEFAKAQFILEDGKYICGVETEKMSKSKYNTVNPDDLCNKYGADTFRMYEMFLGPVEASKPWDTKGIEGVHRFLRKLWRLFNDEVKGPIWTSSAPSQKERAGGEVTDAELKVLHRTIKKIEEDTERFSFNTAVSTFMICVNELADLKCNKKEILEPLLILLTPYAPHIAEELWRQLGNEGSILDASYPVFNPALLVESSKEYPVSVN